MSKKQFTYDSKGQPQKLPGWFSWRHQTRDAHDSAVARYLEAHGPEARRNRANITRYLGAHGAAGESL